MEDGIVDIEKVKKIKKIMPSDDLLFDIAEVFKVFGDTTRMKIISALLEAELCVGDIAEITNSTQSAISHQLRVLKQAKLVKFRKEGKVVYYSLDDEHISEMYEMAKRHIEEGYEHKWTDKNRSKMYQKGTAENRSQMYLKFIKGGSIWKDMNLY